VSCRVSGPCRELEIGLLFAPKEKAAHCKLRAKHLVVHESDDNTHTGFFVTKHTLASSMLMQLSVCEGIKSVASRLTALWSHTMPARLKL